MGKDLVPDDGSAFSSDLAYKVSLAVSCPSPISGETLQNSLPSKPLLCGGGDAGVLVGEWGGRLEGVNGRRVLHLRLDE